MLNRSPLSVVLDDLRDERRARVPFPPGETRFSLPRTRRFAEEPLEMLLESYERFGPIFTLRLFHSNVVFMLGPAANHYILVSHASNFHWREGSFRDLIGLMGDGLLTIDGDFHRRSRRIMLPAFHRENIAASVDAIREETERAIEQLEPGTSVDLYDWTRHLAMRVAMRALFGLDPDGGRARAIDAAGLFEEALAFYASDYLLRVFRGKRSPWGHMQVAARKLDTLIYAEIADRRAIGPARQRHPQPAARRRGRGRQPPQRRADPRRGDDAAVRRTRHDHIDDLVHVLRARAPAGDRRAAARRAAASWPTGARAPRSCSAASCPSSRW